MTESQKGRYYFNPCHYRMDYLVSKKINSQRNPALPDYPERNTAREEINEKMPGIDNVSGVKNVVEVWMTVNIVGKKNIQ